VSKFYTAFLFKFELDPNEAHCTHKYLGELNFDSMIAVQNTITRYLAVNGLMRFPAAVFNKEEFFGPNKLIRVLTPNVVVMEEYRKRLFPDLRDALNQYRKDEYEYTPHVSTEVHYLIQSEFKYYAFIESPEGDSPDIVVKHWDL
jgi:hypothetical protein